jgi:hypothetical protein
MVEILCAMSDATTRVRKTSTNYLRTYMHVYHVEACERKEETQLQVLLFLRSSPTKEPTQGASVGGNLLNEKGVADKI